MFGKKSVLVVLGLVLLIAALAACSAQPAAPDYPTKNITLVVPFKPGGGFDLQARIIAPFIEKYLPKKTSVVIQNVDGAGGRLGASQLAKSKPDGYTIGVVGLESVSFMYALGQLEDNPESWTALGQLSSDALLVAVNSKSGLSTPASMKGKDFRFGVTSEMLPSAAVISKAVGSNFRPVLFDGSGDAVLAATRGDLDAVVFSWPTMIKGVRDSKGALQSAFVVSKSRLSALQDVPTLEELGIKPEEGVYAVVGTSRMIVGPAGIDKAVQGVLVDAITKAEADPEFVAQMKKGEFDVATAKPEDIKARIKSAVDEFNSVKDMVKSYVK